MTTDPAQFKDAEAWERGRALARRPLLVGALAAGLAACSTSRPAPGDSAPSAGAGAASATPAAAGPASSSPAPADPTAPATGPLAGWSLEQRVGQLLMMGVDAAEAPASARRAVTSLHLGGVFLSGRSQGGTAATRAVVDSLTGLVGPESTGGAPLLVSTDQEGGDVQVLRGQGFSTIPSALKQSEQSAADLETAAAGWGGELAQAGVTMNLAPVADLVDIADPDSNEPIGAWGRQYGNDKETVIERAGAFARGMESAGVVATFKHFPGLGRVAGNTDTSASVTDAVTARTGDAAVEVFSRFIADGARVVMVSSAVYTLIDAGSPAVFSSVVVTDMLRGDLGFTGVVITDDVSAAAQVSTWSPAERAVLAVRAGCDIVLASGDPGVVEEMAQGMVDRARTDPAFAARVDESALRVLALKGVQS